MNLLADAIVIPFMLIALVAWIVPKLLAMVFAEGVRPLIMLTLFATLLLFAISGGIFLLLYVVQGAPLAELADGGWLTNVVFFGRLGLSAAIIWVPIMLLSVSGLPRHWKEETW